ncbi:MAG: GatB/YqeY domain-containing protein [Planctomycetes bacterium]|nr:GatB/YqeY domain-containing protein [Planctomycetota bacterium]
MSTTRKNLDDALKTAMKARDTLTVETLRFLNASLRRTEVDERRTLTEPEVVQSIQKGIKRMNESIDGAVAAGREDAAAPERAQREILQRFLPQQLSEAELITIVEASIKESGAVLRKEQGKVMAVLMPRIAGVADGKLASQLVAARLQ